MKLRFTFEETWERTVTVDVDESKIREYFPRPHELNDGRLRYFLVMTSGDETDGWRRQLPPIGPETGSLVELVIQTTPVEVLP